MTTKELDRSAFRAYVVRTKAVNIFDDAAMMKAYMAIRPQFGEDSVGFRTFLIFAGEAEVPELQIAADYYLENSVN